MNQMENKEELPGFRFHPTEEELLDFYLKNMIFGKKSRVEVIGFLNIYRHDPWDLPGLSSIGEREWYFFVPRDRKHGTGGRPSRTTEKGYWKATGSDRKIMRLSEPRRVIGLKKTLVFYHGRAPGGTKTDWVMNEFRLPDGCYPLPKDIVLCKIYRKATSFKVLEQRAEMEMTTTMNQAYYPTSPLSSSETISFCNQQEESAAVTVTNQPVAMEEQNVISTQEDERKTETEERKEASSSTTLKLPFGSLPELQLPIGINDLVQEANWSLNSPWFLQNLTPIINLPNF